MNTDVSANSKQQAPKRQAAHFITENSRKIARETTKMGPELNKIFYNTTVAQCVSTCGEYLFAGNNFGDIFVYK